MSAASVKLSPLLKSLISASHAKPGAVPAPASNVFTSLFEGIRLKGEKEGIEKETWVTLNTAALLTINSPNALCGLYDYAAGRQTGMHGRVRVAAVMRETGLKCISFNGIPRTINGLGAMRTHLPEDVVSSLSTHAEREPNLSNIESIKYRGRSLWDSIYQPHHLKLLSKLSDSHPDLPIHILNSHYGPLLSDPFPTSPSGGFKIGRILTSVVAISCLRAQTGVGPQVTSHVFGLKKALLEGGGIGPNEERLAGEDWLCSDEGVQWVLESTDEISAVVAGEQGSFAAPIKRESKL